MKISAVIDTYGSRAQYLKQTIISLRNESVDDIIIINNNSSSETKKYLNELISSNSFHIRNLDENRGSAEGFKIGIEVALRETTCDFLWLLDDDNVVCPGALERLIDAYNYLGRYEKNVIYSYRGNARPLDKKAITTGCIKQYNTDWFMGFSLTNLSGVIERLSVKRKAQEYFYPLILAKFGPYGGMFFCKNLISDVGYPNIDFFLYADDHEYSIRMLAKGYKLYLAYESKIKEVDVSFREKSWLFDSKSSDMKVYYSLRNHIYLEMKYFVRNKYRYYLNMLLWLAFKVSIGAMNSILKRGRVFKRLKLVFTAVFDGLSLKIGKVDIFDNNGNLR